ncbi:MAG: glycosyltransferase [Caulobacteraceae bacterium]|nr:glycosyltransferase [Caulobacteraceae bacterium]
MIGCGALGAWLYLLLGRGGFWRARERDDVGPDAPAPAAWPSVVAVVPARDEADVVARSIASLAAQDYPGAFRIILVDDGSTDGTAAAAADAAADRLEIIKGAPPPAGWTGKLWAQRQGIERVGRGPDGPDYLLLTDADIAHAPDNLRRLVARAEAGGLVLTSLMAKLAVETWAERLLIPAFVFFFDMLYPFARVNDPRRRVAAAAGGCMLARRDALEAAGGVEAIKGAIIDDCALAARMKRQGPVWLGLTDRARSLRPYGGFDDIARMVSRSAYAQLGYSPWLLTGTVLGMGLVHLSPPLLALFAQGPGRWAGIGAWLAMALAFQPMLRFYHRSPAWGFALPLIGALYAGFTVRSAAETWRGKGGMWKGRVQGLTRSHGPGPLHRFAVPLTQEGRREESETLSSPSGGSPGEAGEGGSRLAQASP